MVTDTFDPRWKNPTGPTPPELFRWAQDLIKELRGGAFVNSLGIVDVEGAQDAVGTILSDAGDIDFTYDDATPAITAVIKNDAVTTAKILNDAVTYAKLQNISAQFRALGRNSASAGDAEEVTFSQLLDWIGSAAQGDILYRGASSWARLGVGTNRQFLQTQGAAADPQYAFGGLTLLTSGVVSNAATLDIVLTGFTGFRAIKFLLSSFLPATDDVELWMRFSTDGGSNYDATGYAYAGTGLSDDATARNIASGSDTEILIAGNTTATASVSNVADEGGVDAEITLHDQTAVRWSRVRFSSSWRFAVGNLVALHGAGQRETAQDTNAVRFLFEGGGNIASGNYAVYGLA